MESVLGRYRNLTILVGVLFLQVLGLAVQVKRTANAQSTRLIRVWTVGAITPFERLFIRAQDGSDNLWHNYIFLRGVRAENRGLKKQIEDMRLAQVRMSEDATQAHRLQSLLGFKEQFIEKTVAAQVIGSSGSDLSRSIYIDKGDDAKLKPDMAVITSDGIVGKIWIVYPSTSLVLMINDQSSGVGALLDNGRLQGSLRGTAEGELVLDRVMSDEKVAPGDTVLSSGGDQIFPKGLPVGTVTKVSPGHEMFLSIKVKPAADLSRLEEVLVVTEKQERQPAVADGGQRVRAADILAQRLPSVPDKPEVPVGTISTAATSSAPAAPVGSGANAGSAGAKPAANELAKPATRTLPAAAGVAPAANHGGLQVAPVAGLPVNGDVLKKAVQKTPSTAVGNAGSKNAAGSNPTSPANSPANPNAGPKSLNPAVKPATPRSAPATPPSNPQPAAADDNPH
jgi:rod shape-determining protein MreC